MRDQKKIVFKRSMAILTAHSEDGYWPDQSYLDDDGGDGDDDGEILLLET